LAEDRVEARGARIGRLSEAGLRDPPRGVDAGGEGVHGVADLVAGEEDAAVDGLRLYGPEQWSGLPQTGPGAWLVGCRAMP
jgi:hypothetical protein